MSLLVSNKWDLTVDFVVHELRERGAEFLRLNTEDLVKDGISVTFPEEEIAVNRDVCLTREVDAVWWRRPGKPFDGLPAEERPPAHVVSYVEDQWYACLESLQLNTGAIWVNHPQTSDKMESKTRQLSLARDVGFDVPRTLVSNDPQAIRKFAESCRGGVVAKSLFAPLIEEKEQDYFLFTTAIGKEDLGLDDELQISPTIYQEMLTPKVDYRLTIVGDQTFPVRVESELGAETALDWRTQKKGMSFVSCELPTDVTAHALRFVHEAGLLFGAIDLVCHDDVYYFLEINPNGEWGWLQKPYGVPIASAIADVLLAGAKG